MPISIPNGTFSLSFTGPLQQGQPEDTTMGALTVGPGAWSFSLDAASQGDTPYSEPITPGDGGTEFTVQIPAGNPFGVAAGDYVFTATSLTPSPVLTISGTYTTPDSLEGDEDEWIATARGADTDYQ